MESLEPCSVHLSIAAQHCVWGQLVLSQRRADPAQQGGNRRAFDHSSAALPLAGRIHEGTKLSNNRTRQASQPFPDFGMDRARSLWILEAINSMDWTELSWNVLSGLAVRGEEAWLVTEVQERKIFLHPHPWKEPLSNPDCFRRRRAREDASN